jgi:hypothetical protein
MAKQILSDKTLRSVKPIDRPAAYNRAQYLEERRRMMQSWGDYLDGLRNGAQVIAFKRQSWHGTRPLGFAGFLLSKVV